MRVGVMMAMSVLAAGLVACASDTTTTSAPVGTTSSSTSSAPPTSASVSPSEEPEADVVLSNFRFAPDQIPVTSGDTITLVNASTTTSHSFTVTGQPIDVIVDVGAEAEATIDLEAGTYDLICKFHETSGMVGTLVVDPVGA